MGSRLFNSASLLLKVFMAATALSPTHGHGYCPYPKLPPTPYHPPHIKPPPSTKPAVIYPPPPPRHPALYPPAPSPPTCPINALKLGLCLDVLGGLVHVGVLGYPGDHVCCPVIQGLLEVEAAVCLCTAIRLKLLNLNILFTLALEVFATCGEKPPSSFGRPPVHL